MKTTKLCHEREIIWRSARVNESYNYRSKKVHVLIILKLTLRREPHSFIHTAHTVDQLVSRRHSDHSSEFFNMFGDIREVEKLLHPAINEKNIFFSFLGSFAKLWKTTISFIMSVRPSVCPAWNNSDPHLTDFHETTRIPTWRIFMKFDTSVFS